MPRVMQSINASEKGEAITYSFIPKKQSENRNGNVFCPERVLTPEWWQARSLHAKRALENKVGHRG